jgi:hypothetical protein
LEAREEQPWLPPRYASELGPWAARALLADAGQRHAVCAIARLLRLLAVRPERLRAQAAGALLRLVMMFLRDVPRTRQAPALAAAAQEELLTILDRARVAASDPVNARKIEKRMCMLAAALWPAVDARSVASERHSLTPKVERLGA